MEMDVKNVLQFSRHNDLMPFRFILTRWRTFRVR